MSRLRKLKQKARSERNLKIQRQKLMFSLCFIFTVVISFSMLVFCATNKAPTPATTIISGSCWLAFIILFSYALKNKWYILFAECSSGRFSFNYRETAVMRKKNNWQGNCTKFAVSLIILLIHLVLLIYEIL